MGVDGGALGGGRLEADLLGLPVHDDEVVGEVSEHADRCSTTADDGAAATLGRDDATEQQLAVVDVAAGLGHPVDDRPVGGDQPATVDDGLTAARPDDAALGALAEQQPQSGDDHGLAGAGLAGDGGEAGAEGQSGATDHAEVADRDLLDHEVAA